MEGHARKELQGGGGSHVAQWAGSLSLGGPRRGRSVGARGLGCWRGGRGGRGDEARHLGRSARGRGCVRDGKATKRTERNGTHTLRRRHEHANEVARNNQHVGADL